MQFYDMKEQNGMVSSVEGERWGSAFLNWRRGEGSLGAPYKYRTCFMSVYLSTFSEDILGLNTLKLGAESEY